MQGAGPTVVQGPGVPQEIWIDDQQFEFENGCVTPSRAGSLEVIGQHVVKCTGMIPVRFEVVLPEIKERGAQIGWTWKKGEWPSEAEWEETTERGTPSLLGPDYIGCEDDPSLPPAPLERFVIQTLLLIRGGLQGGTLPAVRVPDHALARQLARVAGSGKRLPSKRAEQ